MSSFVHAYAAFGLAIRANRPMPALLPSAPAARRPVELDLAPVASATVAVGDGVSSFHAGMERQWRLDDGGWLLRYDHPDEDAAWTMRLVADGSRIRVARTESIGADEVLPVVQTVGLAASLQLAGEVVLHGSAVAVGGRAILLLGSSGSGKSTTSVALLRAGHALLSDDIAAVTFDEGAPTVHPGPQRMRVAPATARAAGWEPERLPRVFSAAVLGDKLAVDPTGDAFCPIPLSIVAIYVLGPRGRHLQIAPLAPPDALRALLGNGYRSLLLSRAQHGRLLPHLARLAETVPTRRVGAEDDLASLPRLVEALVADAAAA